MKRGRLITLGSFDGVHRGHQALLERTVHEAKKRGLKSTAITFAVPPRMVLDPLNPLRILSESTEKDDLIHRYGIDEVITLNFDQSIAVLKPFSFFRNILLDEYKAKGLVVGLDFRFGMERSAGAHELVKWGLEFEIPVWVISPIKYHRHVVSSSVIRHMLEGHQFRKALQLLNHPYIVQGRVVPERRVGRTLGFPTANLQVPVGKILPSGVFAIRGFVVGGRGGNSSLTGVCNIGVRPTFLKKSPVRLEAHFFQKVANLEGRELHIELLHQLRPEKKFANREALIAAIKNDVRRAKAYLGRQHHYKLSAK